MMDTTIAVVLEKRRSLEQVLADLRAKLEEHPEAEIAERRGADYLRAQESRTRIGPNEARVP
jgi:hypothetical protein